MKPDDEDQLLRSVATQNARSIRLARQQAEQDLLRAKEALEQKTRELAHSLALMRATLESTSDAIAVTDRDGYATDFNLRFAELWRPPADPIPFDGRRAIMDEIAGTLREPEPFLARAAGILEESPEDSFDVLELADGRVFECHSRVQRVHDRMVGRVWSFRDVTETRRMEDALRAEAALLELLNRTGAHLSSRLDLSDLVQAVTDATTELTGARFGAFFYKVAAASDEESSILCSLSGTSATPLLAPTFRDEAVLRCDDVPPDTGTPFGPLPVRSYLAVPVVSRSGAVIGGLCFGHPEVGVFSERTERLVVGIAAHAAIAIDNARLFDERTRLLERERTARGEAERANAMKDEFLATLSHELRTPLNAILGWAQILRTRPATAAEVERGLAVMERNARVQAQLIDDLLDLSRITAGTVRLDVRSVDPPGFIETAMETVRLAADAKGIRLSKRLDAGAGPVMGDPHRLQQVVWNLLSNAVKFTGRDGRVDVVLERLGSHVHIVVADTGDGIAPDFLPHVFDRFRQADPSRSRPATGLGLGLAIVKQLVEAHGGTVSVTSPGLGQGTTFTVKLPHALTP